MKSIYFIILIFTFFSCRENKKDQMIHLVNEWQGKEIIFPENLILTRYLTDTVDCKMLQSDYKILMYVDSIGCTSCKLQLPKWKELMTSFNSLDSNKVSLLFCFQVKSKDELQYLLQRDTFNYPICLDDNDKLYQLNKFPTDITFQTFLLDKNNKVIIVGNPIHNSYIKDLYLNQIVGKSDSEYGLVKTSAQVSQNELYWENVDKLKIKTAILNIKNTGEFPLVIVDVTTTCSCISTTYEEKIAKPGEFLRVEVKMTPKDTGFFDEVLMIRCNTTSPVKVKIKGNVR